jgi:hypothetical protein
LEERLANAAPSDLLAVTTLCGARNDDVSLVGFFEAVRARGLDLAERVAVRDLRLVAGLLGYLEACIRTGEARLWQRLRDAVAGLDATSLRRAAVIEVMQDFVRTRVGLMTPPRRGLVDAAALDTRRRPLVMQYAATIVPRLAEIDPRFARASAKDVVDAAEGVTSPEIRAGRGRKSVAVAAARLELATGAFDSSRARDAKTIADAYLEAANPSRTPTRRRKMLGS